MVGYDIVVDENWRTRTARVWTEATAEPRSVLLEADGSGSWMLDGLAMPQLEGCVDVDLESSVCTNTIPIHRLQLEVGIRVEVPAAYVRVGDLATERLEQTYTRVSADGIGHQYDYSAPRFKFECRLAYDEVGLVLNYPGIAQRVI